MNNYTSGNTPYYEKPYEQGAYNFGPVNPGYNLPKDLKEPILDQPSNQGWFK